MNKGLFNGWKDVFTFTFMQNIKTKTFKVALIGIGSLFFAIFFAINIITGYAMNDHKKANSKCNVDSIILINDTTIENMDFSKFSDFSKVSDNADISVVKGEDPLKLIEEFNSKKTNGIVIHAYQNASKENIKYTFMTYIPDHLSKKGNHINLLMRDMEEYFDQNKLSFSGVNSEINTMIASNKEVSVKNVEKDESIGEMLAKLFIPMIFVLLIYMLIIMHGQSISKNIMVEKSSKIMETLLVSVEPYAIILGKILAMYLVAILQIFVWAIFGLIGFIAGNQIAGTLFDKFDNPIVKVADILKDGSSSAFSAPAIILGTLALLLGFLMYCVLSGLVTSNISKTEDLTNAQSVFQVTVVVSFLASYMLPFLNVNENIIKVLRYIPFTAAFMLPSDVMVGSISLLGTAISLLLILITTGVMVIFTGKIYKKKVF